jgi:hypothetical protein
MFEQAALGRAYRGARSGGRIGSVPTVVLALTRASLTTTMTSESVTNFIFL